MLSFAPSSLLKNLACMPEVPSKKNSAYQTGFKDARGTCTMPNARGRCQMNVHNAEFQGKAPEESAQCQMPEEGGRRICNTKMLSERAQCQMSSKQISSARYASSILEESMQCPCLMSLPARGSLPLEVQYKQKNSY